MDFPEIRQLKVIFSAAFFTLMTLGLGTLLIASRGRSSPRVQWILLFCLVLCAVLGVFCTVALQLFPHEIELGIDALQDALSAPFFISAVFFILVGFVLVRLLIDNRARQDPQRQRILVFCLVLCGALGVFCTIALWLLTH